MIYSSKFVKKKNLANISSRLFILLILIIFSNHGFCQTIISGNTPFSKSPIIYFEPFLGQFYNMSAIKSQTLPDSIGNFRILINNTCSVQMTIIIGNIPIILFIDPNDRIEIKFNPDKDYTIHGKNSVVNEYYNNVFDYPKMKKFNGIMEILEDSSNKSVEDLIISTEKFLNQKFSWVDSIDKKENNSVTISQIIKRNCLATLSMEFITRSEKIFHSKEKIKIYKEFLFLKNNVFEDDLINNIGTHSIRMLYLKYLESKNLSVLESKDIIIPDLIKIRNDNPKLQEYLYFHWLFLYYNFDPNLLDYCESSNKYKLIYPNSPFISILNKMDWCRKTDKIRNSEIEIIEYASVDLFSLITEKFSGKRLFIDLWATWCGPCIMEFSIVPSNFENQLKKYNIQPVFISIDEPKLEKKWNNTVFKLNLKGKNLIASQSIQESIKEIIYNGQNISIPRYIIVDEKGKIIESNAPRPSDPRLLEIFDESFK